jgi:hypothetical protein
VVAVTTTSGPVKSSYSVRATRWRHGWELRIDDDNITQARTLGEAATMVREYLALTFDLTDAKVNKIDIDIVPVLGSARDAETAALRRLNQHDPATG